MQEQLDISAAVEVARRRGWIVALSVALALAGSYLVTLSIPKRYTATATLFVGGNTLRGGPTIGAQYATLAGNLVTSYAQLAQTNAVAKDAAQRAHMPLATVLGHVSSEGRPGAQILRLTGDATSAKTAARVANAAAGALIDRVANLTRPRTNQVEIQAIDRARVPSGPATPRVALNLLVGALAGLLVGLAIVFVRERLDRRIRTPADLERELDLPVLGVTPKLPRWIRGGDALTRHSHATVAEPYRSIAATLSTITERAHQRRILISSATNGDGKSTLAAHLALALAEDNHPTVLLEADLHHPTLRKHFPFDTPGISRLDIDTEVPDSTVVFPNLKVISVGKDDEALGINIRSPEFQRALGAAIEQRDQVLLDAPPVLGASDSSILARYADAVVLVVAAGDTTTDELMTAIAVFRRLGVPLAGAVLTGVAPRHGAYYVAK